MHLSHKRIYLPLVSIGAIGATGAIGAGWKTASFSFWLPLHASSGAAECPLQIHEIWVRLIYSYGILHVIEAKQNTN